MRRSTNHVISAFAACLVLHALPATPVYAHCDGLDGPVVTAAKAALAAGNVDLVLVWVRPEHDAEVRRAFQQTLVVRRLSAEAEALADMYFFETVVRLHRLGEGAPYTGLKPAGRDLGPAIPTADAALESGDAAPLVQLLTEQLQRGVTEHFDQVMQLKTYATADVQAGRRFVAAYVAFVHYVEAAYGAAATSAHGHYPMHQAPRGEEHGRSRHAAGDARNR
jgi:hypothetical protein